MSEYAIETNALSKSFGSLKAVDELTFAVREGEIFGFLGPNGSGKTTTIRLLLGLLAESSGSAKVLGYDVASQSHLIRQVSGALMEHSGLYERLSANDNLDFYGRAWHMPAEERNKRIRELLTSHALFDRRDETVAQWSRGMKQRLAIARAMLHRPRVLFLDEPTTGLDPVAAVELREYLLALAAEGVTLFLNTHNLNEAEKICDRVAVLRQGQIIAMGTPAELEVRKQGELIDVVANEISDDALTLVGRLDGVTNVCRSATGLTVQTSPGFSSSLLTTTLVQAGVRVDEIKKEKATLEDAFIELMEHGNNH